MKRWFGPACGIVVVFGMVNWLSPFRADAATNTVLNLNDSGAGSLRFAISNAAPGDTVVFTNGLAGTMTLTGGEILVDKNLTVAGPGADFVTILGNAGVGRALRVTNATVSLSGLAVRFFTLTGQPDAQGSQPGGDGYGGAILNSGNLTLTDCRFGNNRAFGGAGGTGLTGRDGGRGLGGSLANLAPGSLTLIRCRLDNNQAYGGAGGQGASFGGGNGGNGVGGAIYSAAGLTIMDCWFDVNRAFPGVGGAGSPNGSGGFALGGGLHAVSNPGTAISGSTFSANSANGFNARAGGLFVAGGTVSVNNCTFQGNSAVGAGGAIELATTTTLRCTNSTIALNSAPQGGGLDVPANSTAQFRNTIVAGNTASLGAGFGHDVFGPIISQGFNLVGSTNGNSGFTNITDQLNTNPLLGPLQDNGGATPTMLPSDFSPALDNGFSGGIATDQRGRPRGFDHPNAATGPGDQSDIGACEVVVFPSIAVSNKNNSGDGSLRQAVQELAVGGTITFAPAVTGTITLTSGELVLGKQEKIVGPGAKLLAVSGNNASRVFKVLMGPVNLSGVTITGGNPGGSGLGGGILNQSIVNLANCVIASNSALHGGGVYDNGTMTASNCTFFANSASADGAGVYGLVSLSINNSTFVGNAAGDDGGAIYNAGQMAVSNSTFHANSAVSFGGALVHIGSAATIRNTIVGGNSSEFKGPDVYGTFTSQGFNLIGNGTNSAGFGVAGDQVGTSGTPINPLLGPLQDNGGPTPTMQLLAGSPAIDRGHSGGATTDQRGRPRPFDQLAYVNVFNGDGSDIGAYEISPVTNLVTTANDSGPGSLRQAIQDAFADDIVAFSGSVGGTIAVTNGELVIGKNLTVAGPGANLLTIRGKFPNPVFHTTNGSVTISGLKITRGYFGGCVLNSATAKLLLSECILTEGFPGLVNEGNGDATLNACTVYFNVGADGGGIYNAGRLAVLNSTIASNSASGSGGGIFNANTGVLAVRNSTVAYNDAQVAGGGIDNSSGYGTNLTAFSSLIAANTAPAGPDVNGAVTSSGYNMVASGSGSSGFTQPSDLVNGNAGLGLLADNGGPTPTIALLPGSQAIDKGRSVAFTDQRRRCRVFDDPNVFNVFGGNGADIGAFEVNPPHTTVVANVNDSGADSLRHVLCDCQAGETITFAPGVSGTITLNGPLIVPRNLTIAGPGARTLAVSGNNVWNVFYVLAVEPVFISGLTVTRGYAYEGNGAGIYNAGALTLSNCLIASNAAPSNGLGAGVYNAGRLIASNCTFSENSAYAGGGFYGAGIQSSLINSSFSGNSAVLGGAVASGYALALSNCTIFGNVGISMAIGGVANLGGTATVRNTIIAGNSGSNPDVSGTFASQGFNLIGDTSGSSGFGATGDQLGTNAMLGPLADNGGPTPTMKPLPGSPAIDRGHAGGILTDQRGRPRPYDDPSSPNGPGDLSDIGAYEISLSPAITVTGTNDSGDGSLRLAIEETAPGGIITFSPSVSGVIALTGGELLIGKSLNIVGPCAKLLTLSGNNSNRVFHITNGNVNISGLTIANGFATDSGAGIRLDAGSNEISGCCIISNRTDSNGFGTGGGLYVDSDVTLTVENSTLAENEAGAGGGGIFSPYGSVITIRNSTISRNRTTFVGGITTKRGGGIAFGGLNSGILTLISTTITGNSSTNGGGIDDGGGSFIHTITNCIIAGNSGVSGPDLKGAYTSGGFNLVGTTNNSTGWIATDQLGSLAAPLNPLLGPLADYGGCTPTHALVWGSPALDKGRSPGLTLDQRGFARTVDDPVLANASGGDGADIGAFEADPIFRIVSFARSGNDTELMLTTMLGRNYRVEFTNELSARPWTTLKNFPGNGQLRRVLDVNGGNQPRRFYRGVIVP